MSEPTAPPDSTRTLFELQRLSAEVDELNILLDDSSTIIRSLFQLLRDHNIPVGSPELIKAREKVEVEMQTLRTANAGLVEKIRELEAARTQAAANSLANMLSYEEVVERMKRLDARYQSLIMLVATKHPTETRHDTAARYIREREGLQPLPASEGKILPCGVKSSVAKGHP